MTIRDVFDLVALTLALTLIYKLDQVMLPLDVRAEINVCASIRLVVRVVMDIQADTHDMMSKLFNDTSPVTLGLEH